MSGPVQFDLFGEVEAAEDTATADAQRKEQERSEWAGRFERYEFPAPYDTAMGIKKGTPVLGWVCPACKHVEWSEFTLSLNHGYDPHEVRIPGHWAGLGFGDTCNRLGFRSIRDENHAHPANDPIVLTGGYDLSGVTAR